MTSHIKRFFYSFAADLYLRVIAIIIAVGAWFFIAVQVFPESTTHVDNIPISIDLTNEMRDLGLEVVGNTEYYASVQYKGKRYEINNLTAADFTVAADLSGVKSAGEHKINISAAAKENLEIEIIGISPDNIKLSFDRIVSKTFDVVPYSGNIKTAENYYLEELELSPKTVTISGDENSIFAIGSCEVRPITPDVISESTTVRGELVIYDKNGNKIENPDLLFDTNSFNVNIPVYKRKVVPIQVSFQGINNFNVDHLKYEISPSEIEIASPNDTIDQMSFIDIGTISLSEVKLDYTKTLPIELPPGYKILSGISTAKVTFDTTGCGLLEFTTTQINITNVPDNYEVTNITKEIKVTLIGPSEVISALKGDDITAICNLFGTSLSEGSKSMTVTFLTKSARVWVVGSYQIDLNISLKEEEEP